MHGIYLKESDLRGDGNNLCFSVGFSGGRVLLGVLEMPESLRNSGATSEELLGDFARNRSEAAFRELVQRHLPLVYNTAVRVANGDQHLAEDIAQMVFTDLAA